MSVRSGSEKIANSPTPDSQAPMRAGTAILVMFSKSFVGSIPFFLIAYSIKSCGVDPGRHARNFLPLIIDHLKSAGSIFYRETRKFVDVPVSAQNMRTFSGDSLFHT